MSCGAGPLTRSSRRRAGRRRCPALARSLRGSAGFSSNPTTRPSCTSTMPHCGRVGGAEQRQRGDRRARAVRVDRAPQVEVGQVVGVDRQEHVLVGDEVAVRAHRPGAAEQLRLLATCTHGGPTRRPVGSHDGRQVVQVDQHLVDARPRPAHPARCRAAADPADPDHALGRRVGDRPQPGAEPGGQQERLHRDRAAAGRRPSDRIFASASARTASSPGMPASHAAYSATDSSGRALRRPAELLERVDVGDDVPGVAEPVLAADPPGQRRSRSGGARCRRTRAVGVSGTAADVEHPARPRGRRSAPAHWRRRRRGC